MTNFEYYSTMLLEDIEHYESENKDSYEILSELFNEGYCTFTRNDQTYIGKLIKWLKQEYRPPYKLTRFEKDVLENASPKLIYAVKKYDNDVCLMESDKWKGLHLHYPFPNAKFDCLKIGEYYKIADILANCEVINVEDIGF